MTQTYETVLVEKVEKTEEPESLGELNPRYFEETFSLKEAQERVDAASNYSSLSFNPFGL
ncbi:MAG: hypothetical protein ACFFE4_10225 [Candidatus Thorarchaeota archaeon]